MAKAARPDGDGPLHVMLVAGEPSGDLLGGQLMRALSEETDAAIRFSGVGGEAMAAEGLESLFSIADTSLTGIQEVLPKIPLVLRRIRETADAAIAARPDVVVLIDSPDFTHRVAARIRKRAPDLPLVKYVAPQVWASRPGRARKLARLFDHMLTLLPFEPGFFADYGLSADFVGHPVVERTGDPDAGRAFRAARAIAPDTPLLAILPGSRGNEIARLLPVFREAAELAAQRVPGLEVLCATVPHVADDVRAGLEGMSMPVHVVDSASQRHGAFRAADAALAASGTVSTELALAGTPMVIGYMMGPLSSAIARRIMTSPFVTLINVIHGRGVIPEYLLDACTPEALADEVVTLLTDQEAADRQRRESTAALQAMGMGGDQPSRRAARSLLSFLARRQGVSDGQKDGHHQDG
jgi:lipid-A-disaccharide synthase